MNNPIYLTIGLVIMIHLFGQIYFFRVKRVLPTLQKHYSIAKSDVAARENGHLTSKSNFPNWQKDVYALKSVFSLVQKDVSMLKSVFAIVQNYFSMLKSIYSVVRNYISMLKSVISVVQNYFSTLKSVFAAVQNYFSTLKCVFTVVQNYFSRRNVFLQQAGVIIRTWKRIYAHLHICYAASGSLSASLLIYIKTSLRNSPFIHRNFPMIMRFIYSRKQHVFS